MDSSAKKSVLMICGDYMEEYEAMVPFQVLQAFGIQVDCVSPNKYPGDICLTALPGHLFKLNSSFEDVEPEKYDALVIPGGRFTELLSVNDKVLNIVQKFHEEGKPIATTCHSQLVLIAAGIMGGKKCSAFPSLKPVVILAGGIWCDPEPISACFVDENIISAVGWPAHAEYLSILFGLLGVKFIADQKKSILFLCGDYVENYEVNVPFQAMKAIGCRVEAVSPTKKKGENCVTAIHDDEGAQVCSEKRGHNFNVTTDWKDICVEDYDCVVIPGGRSPEFLVLNDKVVAMVKEFAEQGKVVAAIGQGKLLLAAAGVIVKVAGGEVVKSAKSFVHGNVVTATGWSVLPHFISDLAMLLGFTVHY
ncbi:D-lactate dehydratase [Ranunculus cassubicifolius]